MVYAWGMDAYSTALKHYLETPGVKQDTLAEAIGCKQPTVHRYAAGDRFPNSQTARLIDQATGGIVSFALWQSVAMKRLGIEPAPTDEARAA